MGLSSKHISGYFNKINNLYTALGLALLLNQVMSNPAKDFVIHASNEFSNKLYTELASEPGNLLVCPLSLHVALELVHQGAGGRTAQELTNVLRLDRANDNTREGYKAILTDMQDDVIKMVTKLYPKVGYQLKSNYTNIAKQYFLSEIEAINYSEPVVAVNTINKYVEDHTNNKIHDLIKADSISEDIKLIIVNAVHFMASWKSPFDEDDDYVFKKSPSEIVPVFMMTQTNYFDYKDDHELDAKILRMEYKEGDYSMIFILPNKDDGLPALEDKLSSTSLDRILSGLYINNVHVIIPKFRIEKSMDLVGVLNKMGINDMFSPVANLHNIADGEDGNLYISFVIQKTFINVHENGTEAAATTGLYGSAASSSSSHNSLRYFIANHPFHFILLKEESIVFRGRLVDPKL